MFNSIQFIWFSISPKFWRKFWIVVNVLYYFSILLLFPLFAGRVTIIWTKLNTIRCVFPFESSVEFFFKCFCSFLKIGPKGCQCLYSLLSAFGWESITLQSNKRESPLPSDALCKLSLNACCSNGREEDIVCVKSVQTAHLFMLHSS